MFLQEYKGSLARPGRQEEGDRDWGGERPRHGPVLIAASLPALEPRPLPPWPECSWCILGRQHEDSRRAGLEGIQAA